MTALHDRDTAECAYALLLEGIGTVFVNDEALDDTWAASQDVGRTTHPGFRVDLLGPLTTETSIRESTFPTNGADIVLAECTATDELGAIFGGVVEEADLLDVTIEPGGGVSAMAQDKHVGVEFISVTATRGKFPCTPGFTRPLRHLGKDQASAMENGEAAAALVSDSPIVMAGRRFTIYRVFLQNDGTYEDLTDAQLIWWGTLRGQGKHKGTQWTLSADGPDSWLERWINRNAWETPQQCFPVNTLRPEEMNLRGTIRVGDGSGSATYIANYGTIEADTYLTAALDYDTLQGEINTFLDDLIADTSGTDGAFTAAQPGYAGGDIRFEPGAGGRFWIGWDESEDLVVLADLPEQKGRLLVSLKFHEKVWNALGFDPEQQRVEAAGYLSDHFVAFQDIDDEGYRSAYLSSASDVWYQKRFLDGVPWDAIQGEERDSGGERTWEGIYPGGIAAFDSQGQQDLQILSYDELLLEGQLTQPPMAALDDPDSAYTISNGAGLVTDQRLFLFTGPYLGPGDDEPRTINQVARCSFRRTDGRIAVDDDGRPRMVIEQWYDPRIFHIPEKRFTGTWATLDNESAVTCRPLAELAYNRSSGDAAVRTMLRLMLSTGTADGWKTTEGGGTAAFGTGQQAWLTAGTNEPTDNAGIRKDCEIYDLSLQIPESMVHDGSDWWDVWQSLDGAANTLGYGKTVLAGTVSSATVLQELMAPRGWAWSVRARKYGIFDPTILVTPENVDVVLTTESYHNPDANPTEQDHTYFGAIGATAVRAGRNPVKGSENYEPPAYKSIHHAAEHLTNGVEHSIRAPGLHSPDDIPAPTANDWWAWARWESDFIERWRTLMRFSARRHFPITVTLNPTAGADVWPGTRIMITDASIYDPYTRTYGITGFTGYCVSRSEDIDAETIECELFIHADSAYGIRAYGPACRMRAYDANDEGQGYRLFVDDDFRGFRKGGTRDVTLFVEPSLTSHGGSADIEIWQYDRTGWTGGVYGTISSVNSAVDDSYIVLDGALTGGTLYRDTDKIVTLRDWDNQGAAWVTAIHAPICDDAGEVGGSAGRKFNGL